MSIEESSQEVFVGTVVFFKKEGWGFIEWTKNGLKQPDMFAHFSDIDMPGFKILEADTKVSFQLGINLRGQPKAINIRPVESTC